MSTPERDYNEMPIKTPEDGFGSDLQPTDPKRLRGFATFFKNYMSVSTVVVAAAPIPVGSLHLIPTFSAQRGLIMTLSSLLSFLLLAFVFFNRVTFGRAFFRQGESVSGAVMRLVPLVFIVPCEYPDTGLNRP